MTVLDTYALDDCPVCFAKIGEISKYNRVCPECGTAFFVPSRIVYRKNWKNPEIDSEADPAQPEEETD